MTNPYWKPKGNRLGYIDGDLLVYSGCAKHENDDFSKVVEYLDGEIEFIRDAVNLDDFEIFVTARDNFRKEIYPEYKANRKKLAKPRWMTEAYKYLYNDWGAHAEPTYEADDLLGIAMTENPDGLLCSYDKDLDQIVGWHFNWRKRDMYFVAGYEAKLSLALQCLTGDRTDNIPGLRGIGPVKAKNILFDSVDYLRTIIDTYEEHEQTFEDFAKQYKCLKILRTRDKEWPELDRFQ